uniref:Uncharacterized protein n=1 Tax=Arundo donax TaxID=35708 RepID=A0A0A9F9S6_ARUDO
MGLYRNTLFPYKTW